MTGENIVIKNKGGNAELFDEQQCAWLPVFRWTERGSISFNASSDFEEATSHLRVAASKLARKLCARLVGDEGEPYL